MTERKYGGEACGAGTIEDVDMSENVDLGPCPGCAAMLTVGEIPHPLTQRPARAVLHPLPFCNYYGATDPDQIEADVRKASALS